MRAVGANAYHESTKRSDAPRVALAARRNCWRGETRGSARPGDDFSNRRRVKWTRGLSKRIVVFQPIPDQFHCWREGRFHYRNDGMREMPRDVWFLVDPSRLSADPFE